MKAPSPLLGFNNNVRHKGRMFHIQTEDSGIRHPHIITHLFADGGRILKTTKTSYAEHVGAPSMAETVRELMKEQHKAMFIALRDGQFDYLFDESAPRPPSATLPDAGAHAAPAASPAAKPAAEPPPRPSPAASRPAAPSPAEQVRSSAATPASVPPPASQPARAPQPRAAAGSSRPAMSAASATMEPIPPSKRTSSRPRLDLDPVALQALGARPGGASAPAVPRPGGPPPSFRPARPAAPPPSVRSQEAARAQEAQPTIDLDLDALERAATEAQTPFLQQIQDLPPPPASVIGRRVESAAGSYSAVHPAETPVVAPAPLPTEQLGGGAGRYAPSRPSSIFATNRPAEGASIFGEDLISEKSLDEVILSYLAEDLDGPDKK